MTPEEAELIRWAEDLQTQDTDEATRFWEMALVTIGALVFGLACIGAYALGSVAGWW